MESARQKKRKKCKGIAKICLLFVHSLLKNLFSQSLKEVKKATERIVTEKIPELLAELAKENEDEIFKMLFKPPGQRYL